MYTATQQHFQVQSGIATTCEEPVQPLTYIEVLLQQLSIINEGQERETNDIFSRLYKFQVSPANLSEVACPPKDFINDLLANLQFEISRLESNSEKLAEIRRRISLIF